MSAVADTILQAIRGSQNSSGGSLSSEFTDWKMANQVSPILLTGGIASQQTGGVMPLLNLLGGTAQNSSPEMDGFAANFVPMPGGTLISNQAATYPFVNQAVAANAIIVQPLNFAMVMIIPATPDLTFGEKQSMFIGLQSSLKQHCSQGGLFSVTTPAFIYTDCILLQLQDITGEGNQPQYQWRFDFFVPLVSLAAAQQAQNSLMTQLTNGTPIQGTPSWSTGLPTQNPGGVVTSYPSGTTTTFAPQ